MLYLLMTLAGFGAAATAFWQSDRKRELAATFVAAAAVIMLADYIAYGWFDLYHYHPGLLASEVDDSALGEFLADLVFVPSLTVALLAWFPTWVSIALGTFFVSALEWLFVRLYIFHQTGWQFWYTTALFPVYFYGIATFWQRAQTQGIETTLARRLLRSCLVFDALGFLTLYIRGRRLVTTNIHLLPSSQGNQALGRFLTYILIAGPLGYWALSDRRQRPARLAGITLALVAFNYIVLAVNFQTFRPPWNAWVDALAQGAALYVAGLVEDGLYAAFLSQPHSLRD